MRIEKTIGDFIGSRKFPEVNSTDTVASAVAAMKSANSDCVLVCDDGALVGLFTERDFLHRVAGPGRDPAAIEIGTVMTAGPETLSRGDCVTFAINRMADGGYRNVPIVEESGAVVANLSARDVVDHLAEVFAEMEEPDDKDVEAAYTDIGGGG